MELLIPAYVAFFVSSCILSVAFFFFRSKGKKIDLAVDFAALIPLVIGLSELLSEAQTIRTLNNNFLALSAAFERERRADDAEQELFGYFEYVTQIQTVLNGCSVSSTIGELEYFQPFELIVNSHYRSLDLSSHNLPPVEGNVCYYYVSRQILPSEDAASLFRDDPYKALQETLREEIAKVRRALHAFSGNDFVSQVAQAYTEDSYRILDEYQGVGRSDYDQALAISHILEYGRDLSVSEFDEMLFRLRAYTETELEALDTLSPLRLWWLYLIVASVSLETAKFVSLFFWKRRFGRS